MSGRHAVHQPAWLRLIGDAGERVLGVVLAFAVGALPLSIAAVPLLLSPWT